jgi:hypothetical protein
MVPYRSVGKRKTLFIYEITWLESQQEQSTTYHSVSYIFIHRITLLLLVPVTYCFCFLITSSSSYLLISSPYDITSASFLISSCFHSELFPSKFLLIFTRELLPSKILLISINEQMTSSQIVTPLLSNRFILLNFFKLVLQNCFFVSPNYLLESM